MSRRRLITLAECEHILREDPHVVKWGAELVNTAMLAQKSAGLRFCFVTGEVWQARGWISKYSRQSDYTPTGDPIADAADHMSGIVANSCSRLSRGFEAV